MVCNLKKKKRNKQTNEHLVIIQITIQITFGSGITWKNPAQKFGVNKI